MTENLVGKQLGKYQIEAILGRGGMGMVYRGHDPLLDRKVAIKVLAPHLVWEEGFVERFLREARAAARIKHPNIVTVYDVGQEQNQFYFVMEYIEGKTLGEYIRQCGALQPEEVLSILRPLADALDYAHQHGLIHRDIKPGNIMIGSANRVTLTDFGIARAAEETRLTSTGMIMGTPEYMSPEQAWGEEVDCETDLYSLAVVAYEMLSGRVPFSGTTPHAVLYKQIHEPPPSIRDARPELPEGVDTVLARALEKEPGKRHTTAKDFVLELESALAGKLETSVEEAPTELVAGKPETAPEEVPTESVTGKPEAPAPEESAPAAGAPVPAVAPRKKAAARRRVPTVIWALGALGALAILAGVLGMVLLGTGNGEEPTSTPSPQAAARATATQAPPLAPAAETECSDPAGCVMVRPDEPVEIGAMLYLSGPGDEIGASAAHGIEMAMEEKRTIHSHPIDLAIEDTGCEADAGQRAADVLASNPRIVAVIGPICPEAAHGAVERVCAEGIPLVSPSTVAPELTSPDRPGELHCFLRTTVHEESYAEAVAEFVWSLGVRRAAVIQDATLLSESLASRFARHLEELGGEIVAHEVLGPDNPEAAPVLERIAEREPQLIYFPLYFDRAAEITLLARENPRLRDVGLLGADGMFTNAYLGAAGEAAVGTLFSGPDIEVVGPGYVEFLARYGEVYGEPARSPQCASAHDAAMLIFIAIEDVAQRLDDGTLIIGRAALLERLYATRGLNGVTGSLSCNPNGDCGNPSTAVYEIVSPDPANWHPGVSPDSNPRRVWP